MKVDLKDYFDRENERRFMMQDHSGSDEGTRMIVADEEGEMVFKLLFDDSLFNSLVVNSKVLLELDVDQLYLLWGVELNLTQIMSKEQKKLEAERKKAEKEAEKQAAEAEESQGSRKEAPRKEQADAAAAAKLAEAAEGSSRRRKPKGSRC